MRPDSRWSSSSSGLVSSKIPLRSPLPWTSERSAVNVRNLMKATLVLTEARGCPLRSSEGCREDELTIRRFAPRFGIAATLFAGVAIWVCSAQRGFKVMNARNAQ
ncbi:hypothetical protein BV20DRAFT_961961 [Pilatotrama ljubarskyi]|nr:hypothetical protein BV20DRAFT_961961 [Pilatotrama ljubarskyi]